MKREYKKRGICFYIGNYNPRKNDFEKGLKYKLYVRDAETGDDIPTSYTFATQREAREFIDNNYFLWM